METSDYFIKKIEQLRSKVAEIKSNKFAKEASKLAGSEKSERLKMLKPSKIKTLAAIAMAVAVGACAATPPSPAQQKAYQQTDISKFINKVIVVDEQPSTVVYEYHDLRVDEIALLAAMYCQDHGNRHAYLENVILYQNNNRRARFYCSSR